MATWAFTWPATNYILTFDAFVSNASNTVASGAAGNFTVGLGGLGSIALANDLVVTHDGSGTLILARPVKESVAGRSLTKAGNGVLMLNQSNTYSGTTTLEAGTLHVGADTSCGTGPLVLNGGTFASDSGASRAPVNNVTMGGNVTLGQSSGGTGALTFTGALDLGGTTRMFTINNANTTFAGVVSNGGLTKAGSGTLTLAGVNTYTGMNALFAGTLQLGAGGASGSLADASAIAIGPNAIFQFNRSSSDTDFPNNVSGIGTILKTVGGAVEFGLTGTNTFSGLLDIQEGKIAFAGANSENGAPKVNIAAAGTLSIGGGFIGGTATIGNLSGAGRIDAAFNSGAGTRTLQVNQTTDGTFSGVMLDASSGRVLALTKIGPATLTLSGTNTCTGATTVSNGTLIVNGVISNSAVAVKGGATLGGTGAINGPVSVESGGTLSPGASTGTLTISGSLTLDPAATVFIELNTTNSQCDRVQGLTAATYAGTLVVSNLARSAAPTLGQTFPIFSAVPSAAGNFAITPALTGGLAWSFNPTNGLLSVVPATVTYPTNLTYSLSNGTLSLSWPASHLGWIAQSNAVSVARSSNWSDVPGSSSVTNFNVVPSPAWTNVFYRLRSP
jgi:autotransporter-associated beta strand protein